MKIAVLSDTHGLLRPEVLRSISECSAVIHAGDINSQKVIDEMKEALKPGAPFYIVRGNNDKEWAEHLPHHLEFTLAGVNFYMVHNKKELPQELSDRQIIIFGHSHKYFEEVKDGRLWLNPGSCGRRRFNQDITMAVLDIEDGKWSVERIAGDLKIDPEFAEQICRIRVTHPGVTASGILDKVEVNRTGR